MESDASKQSWRYKFNCANEDHQLQTSKVDHVTHFTSPEALDDIQINCTDGALKNFKLHAGNDGRVNYQYSCVPFANAQKYACRKMVTTPGPIHDNLVNSLPNHEIRCKPDDVLSQITLVKDVSRNQAMYEYKCCNRITSAPSSPSVHTDAPDKTLFRFVQYVILSRVDDANESINILSFAAYDENESLIKNNVEVTVHPQFGDVKEFGPQFAFPDAPRDSVNFGMVHTNNTSDSFVMLNLNAEYTIRKIVIENRKDCCQTRLLGTVVMMYDSKFEPVYQYAISAVQPVYVITPDVCTSVNWPGTKSFKTSTTCAPNSAQLQCPIGSHISSGNIRYGRWDNSICPAESVTPNTPPVDSSQFSIPNEAIGKRTFEINQMPAFDVYPNVSKQYEVSFDCDSGIWKQSNGCDDETMQLTCPNGMKINKGIIRYGRWDHSACPSGSVTLRRPNPAFVEQSLPIDARGKNSYTMQNVGNTLNDPMPNVKKHFQVAYQCIPNGVKNTIK
jgi:hypothetical protein